MDVIDDTDNGAPARVGAFPGALDEWLDAPRTIMRQASLSAPWSRRTWTWRGLLDGARPELARHVERMDKDGECLVFGEGVGRERGGDAMVSACAAVLDVDSGEGMEGAAAWMQARGRGGVLYTSHSHLNTESSVDFAKLRTGDRLPSSEDVRDHLRGRKSPPPGWWIDSVEITAPRVRDGARFVTLYRHEPLPKWRLVLPLAEPFLFDAFVDRKRGLELWAAKLRGLAREVGVIVDESCFDPSRLYLLPSCRPGAPRALRVFAGAPLDLDMVEALEAPAMGAGRGRVGPREPVRAPSGMDVRAWHRLAAPGWLAAEWADAHAPDSVLGHPGAGGKATIRCPFADTHGTDKGDADPGTVAIDADPAEGALGLIVCRHATCQGRETPDFVGAILAAGDADESSLFDETCFAFADDDEERADALATLGRTWGATGAPATAGTLTRQSREADVRAVLAAALARGADRTERNQITETIIAGTTYGKRDLNQMWKGAQAEHGARREGAAPGERGCRVDADDYMDQVAYAERIATEARDGDGAPVIYESGSALVTIPGRAGGGARQEADLDAPTLQAVLSRRGRWRTGVGDGATRGVQAPLPVALHVLNDPARGVAFPKLAAIVDAPVFTGEGRLIRAPGWDEESGIFYAPAPGLDVDEVPAEPTDEEVDGARRLLIDPFVDFRFREGVTGRDVLDGADCPDLANVMAWLLTPVMRDLLGSAAVVPGLAVTKAVPGSGASKIILAGQTILSGRVDLRAALPKRPEEQHKEIVAALRSGLAYLAFDNVEEVAGGALALLMTSPSYSGRTLMQSESRVYQNRLMVAFTGNNPKFSKELRRRVIGCRIDAGMAEPDKRDPAAFQHPDLIGHVQANRGALYQALLVIVQAWLARGRPQDADAPVMGSYEPWCAAMGGILQVAGMAGFLRNRDVVEAELAGVADTDDAARTFVEAWLDAARTGETVPGEGHKPVPVRLERMAARDLTALASSRRLDLDLPLKRAPVDEYDFEQRRFGGWLARAQGRHFVTGEGEARGVWTLILAGSKGGISMWSLRPQGTDEVPGEGEDGVD